MEARNLYIVHPMDNSSGMSIKKYMTSFHNAVPSVGILNKTVY